MKLKHGQALIWAYFITVGTATILIATLAVALTIFAGTAYIGADTSELITNLADAGITEDTFLSILKIARLWIMFAPAGFLILLLVEVFHAIKERRGKKQCVA